jgi:hypothetical protein
MFNRFLIVNGQSTCWVIRGFIQTLTSCRDIDGFYLITAQSPVALDNTVQKFCDIPLQRARVAPDYPR